jgi:Flp pilus assembly protein TadG
MKNTSERGQSLVELAISLVLLLVLLSGAVEFGIAFFQFVQLRDAAQEGALYGSMNPPSSSTDTAKINAIATRAKAASSTPINLGTDANLTVTVEVTDAKYCEGGALKVTLLYQHKVFMPFIPQILGLGSNPKIPIRATVTNTILTPVCP